MTSLGEQSLFSSNRRKKRFCQTNGILEKTDVLFKRKYGQDNRKHEVVKRMIQAATAPIVAGLFYLYIRDKYEKEPWRMLVWGILFGVYATFVIYGAGLWLERTFPHPRKFHIRQMVCFLWFPPHSHQKLPVSFLLY